MGPKITNLDPVFLQNVRVHMDSGKDYFFGHSYSLFWLPNLSVFGGHGQFSGFEVPQVTFSGFEVPPRNGPI